MSREAKLEMQRTDSKRIVEDERVPVALLYVTAIFLVSPIGSISTKVELGVISLSGLLTVLLFFLICVVFLASKKLRWNLGSNLLMILVLADVVRGLIQGYQIGNWQSLTVWFTAAAILTLKINIDTVIAQRIFWLVVRISLMAIFVLLAYQAYWEIDDPAAALLATYAFPIVGLRAIKYGRIAYWPLLVALLLFPVITGAKIVLLANVFILGLIVYRTWIQKKALRHKLLGIFCFVLLLISMAFTGLGSSRFQDAAFEGDSALQVAGFSINSSGRVWAWTAIVQSALEKPVFGWGEDVPATVRGERWQQPHNEILRVLHHFGSAGLVLLLLAIYFIRRQYQSRDPRSKFEQQIYEWSGYSTWFLFLVSLTDNPLTYFYVLLPVVSLASMSLSISGSKNNAVFATQRA